MEKLLFELFIIYQVIYFIKEEGYCLFSKNGGMVILLNFLKNFSIRFIFFNSNILK